MATILVVEDSPDTLLLVSMWLEIEGHSVVTAENARQAIRLLPEARPDLVITDIGMPEIDGIQLIKTFRASLAIPIIVLTGYIGDYADKAFEAGANRVFSKPMSPELIGRAVRQLLERHA